MALKKKPSKRKTTGTVEITAEQVQGAVILVARPIKIPLVPGPTKPARRRKAPASARTTKP